EGEDSGNTQAFGAIADCYTELGDLEKEKQANSKKYRERIKTNPTRNRSHGTNFNTTTSLLCQSITNFTNRNRCKIPKTSAINLLHLILHNQNLQNLVYLPSTDSAGEDVAPNRSSPLKDPLAGGDLLAKNELQANIRQSINQLCVEFTFTVPFSTSDFLGGFKLHCHEHLLRLVLNVDNLLHEGLGEEHFDGFLQHGFGDVRFSFDVPLPYPHLLPPANDIEHNALLVAHCRRQRRSHVLALAFPL
ncbi:hypothetical protein CR513_34138, partial [Mucuna pruriens]